MVQEFDLTNNAQDLSKKKKMNRVHISYSNLKPRKYKHYITIPSNL